MPKKENSEKYKRNTKEKTEKESKEEKVSLEEKVKEIKKEIPKEKSKDIIPEFTESRTRNFLNFLNRNSSVTLDKGNTFQEIPNPLELNLEQETKKPENQNSEDKEKNPFEYIPKNEQKEKTQGVYQHYENLQGAKIMRQDEIKNLQSKPFQNRQAGFVQSESGRKMKEESHYQIYTTPQRTEELQKEKKEKGIFITEAKREYYSHE